MKRSFTALIIMLLTSHLAYADKALVMTESRLSVTRLQDTYAVESPIDFDVRVPRDNVIRARLEVIVMKESVSGKAVYQQIRDYDRYTSVGSLSYKIALPMADREGKLALFLRVRGVRSSSGQKEVEPFEETLTWPLEYRTKENAQRIAASGTIDEKLFFGLNSASLSTAQEKQVKGWASSLLDKPGLSAVRVEGHADRVGNQNYNLELSRRRAEAVRRALIKHGVPRHLIDVVGYGFSRPSDKREVLDDTTGIAANRRAEVVWFTRASKLEKR